MNTNFTTEEKTLRSVPQEYFLGFKRRKRCQFWTDIFNIHLYSTPLSVLAVVYVLSFPVISGQLPVACCVALKFA